MPIEAMSMGMLPALWAASTRKRMPRLLQIAPISASGLMAPLTLDAWAATTILAYGPVVKVLGPPELRQLVQAWALAIINLNGNSPDHKEVVKPSVVPIQ